MTSELAVDVLNATLRPPRGAWPEVDVRQVTGSTNADAAAGPRPGRIVVAAEQSAGRGRRRRVWASPPGTSVAISMVVPCPAGPDRGWLPLAVGLAVRDALGELAGDGARFALKWPNDVLGRQESGRWGKVCGILCQVVPGASGDVAIAGVGVNVSVPQAALPVESAVSLHRCGYAPARRAREAVTGGIGAAFAARHAQLAAGGEPAARLRAAYRQACATIGSDVEVHLPDGSRARGRASGVSDRGELVVVHAEAPPGGQAGVPGVDGDEPGGSESVYSAGDVVHIRRARA